MWKSLKDILIAEDKPAEAKPAVAAVSRAPSATALAADASPPASTVVGSVLDVEAVEKEIDGLVQADVHFAPYLEFMKVADAIKGVIQEEGLRYKTAQATTGVDPQTLTDGIKNA